MKNFTKFPQTSGLLFVLALAIFLLTPMSAWSQVKGACVGCHTMHNSQDGNTMATSDAGGTGPNESLLRFGCVGCHTGTNDGGNVPYVNDTNGEPTYNLATSTSLAGGNFYWVDTGAADAKGHNVINISGVDATLNYHAPGFDSSFTGKAGIARGPFDGVGTTQLTCAGVYGCHGDPAENTDFAAVSGAHHALGTTNGFCNGGDSGDSLGVTLAKSYRFLYGIRGIEDADWEYTSSASDHNQYNGLNRGENADTAAEKSTISHLCCECHGAFHEVAPAAGFSSPWIRHPTDFDMNSASGTEYASYNTDGTYSVIAPAASDMSALTGTVPADITTEVVQNIYSHGGTTTVNAVVNCISCHRAHGSAFNDLLRWDYTAMIAGGGVGSDEGEGCFTCHTTKDDH